MGPRKIKPAFSEVKLMSMSSLIIIRLTTWLGFVLLLAPGARGETTGFCAKPWANLTADEKGAIDRITSTVINEVGLIKTSIMLWDTRTIPYYVDSSLSKALIANIKEATKLLADYTLVRFRKCKKEVLAQNSVRGFVYIGKFADFCTSAEACSYGKGMQVKTSINAAVKDESPNSEKQLAKQAAPIGLKESNTKYVILHELIHRLGFAHQHQSPYANSFFAKVNDKDDQCAANTAYYKNVYWIPYYDPASIMHYQLINCKIELVCKVSPPYTAGRQKLPECKIDNLIKDRLPCRNVPVVVEIGRQASIASGH
jgi:hypothetical protein